MTVGELRQRMSYAEFVVWSRVFAVRHQAEQLAAARAAP